MLIDESRLICLRAVRHSGFDKLLLKAKALLVDNIGNTGLS
jgi:hypothetical protein